MAHFHSKSALSVFPCSTIYGSNTLVLSHHEQLNPKCITGRYFNQLSHPMRSSRASYNEGTARALWVASTQLTGLTSMP